MPRTCAWRSTLSIAPGLPVGIDWLGAGLLCYAMLGSGGGSVIWERWYALLEARSGRRRRFDGLGGGEIARRPA
jgi:hypothetical protein